MDIYTSVLVDLIKTLAGGVKSSAVVIKSDNIAAINEEVQKQELELKMAHAQAKVAQEIAIARRIENAKEVILEEYYEGEAEGSIGMNGSESGISLGASASGRKITKRVYRFIGGEANASEKNIYENET
jgi:hypothetical protein